MSRAEDLFEMIVARGEAAIAELLADRQAETMFLDFKRSKDSGRGRRLEQEDRNNMARAISGFGNSEGGIIIWGVECREQDGIDLASARFLLEDAAAFASRLEGAISGLTIPPHPTVRNHAISTSGTRQGYVVTLIPKSELAPHQSLPMQSYHIRAGSAFVPVPHGVLAGLFGKRPQARVEPRYEVLCTEFDDGRATLTIYFHVTNRGHGIARDAFLSVQVKDVDDFFSAKMSVAGGRDWQVANHGNVLFSFTAPVQFRLGYGGLFVVGDYSFTIRREGRRGLWITGHIGCEGSPTSEFSFTQSRQSITAAFDRINCLTHGERSGAWCAWLLDGLTPQVRKEKLSSAAD